jgi:hypothetical protein
MAAALAAIGNPSQAWSNTSGVAEAQWAALTRAATFPATLYNVSIAAVSTVNGAPTVVRSPNLVEIDAAATSTNFSTVLNLEDSWQALVLTVRYNLPDA